MTSEITEISLPCNAVAKTNLSFETLNNYKLIYQLNFSVCAVCLSGRVTVRINTTDYELVPNDLVTIFTGTVVKIKQVSSDARLTLVCFSPEVANQVNPLRVTGEFFTVILDRPVLGLRNEPAFYFKDYISLLNHAGQHQVMDKSADFVIASYNSILVATQLVYKSHTLRQKTVSRKEEICRELIELITQNYVQQRRAQYYADTLGISLQHLSTTVKNVTGKNVLDIIAYMVIMDAKSKLKTTNMTIQEIAFSLNFPSASFFGKYFRRHVNLTPLEYRKR